MGEAPNLKIEVLWKLGRNLVNCQVIERALKTLVSHCDVVVTMRADDVPTTVYVAGDVSGNTLGILIEKFKATVLRPERKEPDVVTEQRTSGAMFSFRMNVVDPEGAKRFVAELDWLVCARNKLAHAFLEHWQPDDDERMAGTIRMLDEQNPRIAAIQSVLLEQILHLHSVNQVLASSEFDAVLEAAWWNECPTLKALKDHAEQGARPDGWCYVSRGAELAWAQAPDDAVQMRDRYGVRTFTELLRAYPDFEVMDEVLPNGATRTLYRMRPPAGEGGALDEPAPAGTVS